MRGADMTALYNCKSEINCVGGTVYRITKFDGDMNVISSYVVDDSLDISCTCPAMGRQTCRHRDMLPKFIARSAINTHWFYDFDRGGWISSDVHLEGALTASAYANIVGPMPNDLLNDIPMKEVVASPDPGTQMPIAGERPHSTAVSVADFESVDVGSNPAGAATHRATNPALIRRF